MTKNNLYHKHQGWAKKRIMINTYTEKDIDRYISTTHLRTGEFDNIEQTTSDTNIYISVSQAKAYLSVLTGISFIYGSDRSTLLYDLSCAWWYPFWFQFWYTITIFLVGLGIICLGIFNPTNYILGLFPIICIGIIHILYVIVTYFKYLFVKNKLLDKIRGD